MVDLQIRQVSFSYFNGLVLNNVSLVIQPGEMVGLLGPNGSGKTTLLKLACGLLKPGRGEIELDGASLRRLGRKTIAQSVAMVPQQFKVSFAFTAAEIVMLGRIPFLRAFAEDSEEDRQIVAESLNLVGIGGLAKRRFDELSGGERQKVILAMALAQEPKLLLLDEPTAHLDISHQVEILELVQQLNAERRLTIIAAIHDLNLASLYFNRLVLLKEGRILADGTPEQVLTAEMINDVFSASVIVQPHPVTGSPHIVVKPRSNGSEQH